MRRRAACSSALSAVEVPTSSPPSNPLLADPAVDGRLTDVHGGGDLRHPSAGTDLVHDHRPELQRIRATAFLIEVGRQSHNPGPTGGGHINLLWKSESPAFQHNL